jgi:hypothetical protein
MMQTLGVDDIKLLRSILRLYVLIILIQFMT